MTARNEKPSPHESSTDTIIGAIEIIANLLTDEIEAQAVRDAAQRLDKLEKELAFMRGDEYLRGRWESADKDPKDDGSVVIK